MTFSHFFHHFVEFCIYFIIFPSLKFHHCMFPWPISLPEAAAERATQRAKEAKAPYSPAPYPFSTEICINDGCINETIGSIAMEFWRIWAVVILSQNTSVSFGGRKKRHSCVSPSLSPVNRDFHDFKFEFLIKWKIWGNENPVCFENGTAVYFFFQISTSQTEADGTKGRYSWIPGCYKSPWQLDRGLHCTTLPIGTIQSNSKPWPRKQYKMKVEGFAAHRGPALSCSEAAALAANTDLETFRKECQATSVDHGFCKFRSLWGWDPLFEYLARLGKYVQFLFYFGMSSQGWFGAGFSALVLCPVPAA